MDDVIEFPKVKVLSPDEALDYVRREGPIEGISKFAKLIGWERTRAQRILARWEAARLITMKSGGPGGKTIIEAVRGPAQPPSEPVAQPDAHPAQPDVQLAHLAHKGATVFTLVGRYAAPVLLGAVGVGLSAVGMVETASYAWAIGGLFCALAVSADVLTLTMPAIIAALWRRRSAAVLLAFGLWLGGVAITTANIAGFIGERTEQYQTGRETGATERAMTLERLARLRDERKAIIETRPTGAIVAAINNARRSEQPALREALAIAKRRDALDAELAFFEQHLSSIPRVTSADASASVLSEISGATVSEGMVRKFRLAALLGLPLTGGLVLSIAFVLAPTRRPREGIAS